MNVLTIAMTLFIILESLNVIILYFKPNSTKGNGVAVFNAFELSKKYPEIHAFIKYMIYWVAGTKLIFILLLVVILFTGNAFTQVISTVVLIASIGTFYWKLYPLIKQMDRDGQISPKGYSKTLGLMIGVFMIVLFGALGIYLI